MTSRSINTYKSIDQAFGFNPLGAALSGLLLERIDTTPTIAMFSFWYLLLALMTTVNAYVRNAPPIEQARKAE